MNRFASDAIRCGDRSPLNTATTMSPATSLRMSGSKCFGSAAIATCQSASDDNEAAKRSLGDIVLDLITAGAATNDRGRLAATKRSTICLAIAASYLALSSAL